MNKQFLQKLKIELRFFFWSFFENWKDFEKRRFMMNELHSPITEDGIRKKKERDEYMSKGHWGHYRLKLSQRSKRELSSAIAERE